MHTKILSYPKTELMKNEKDFQLICKSLEIDAACPKFQLDIVNVQSNELFNSKAVSYVPNDYIPWRKTPGDKQVRGHNASHASPTRAWVEHKCTLVTPHTA